MTRSVEKNITFFYSNSVERETAVPVYEEALRRGYRAAMSDEPFRRAEIGLYCQHYCFPSNSRLSLVMLHDMGQGQLHWPNLWRQEPWHGFDAGILPGDTWVERWQQSCAHPYTRPRLGVFKLGWPKADAVLQGNGTESEPTSALRKQLNLKYDRSILYAPAWENDGKQDEFVRALMDLPVNLLLKQFPWTDQWPDMVREVARVNALHAGIADNVHIIDPDVGIMHCIELADVLVSEESSCLMEALLLGRPTVSVSDWLIPDTVPSRLPAAPFDVLVKTPKAQLRQTIESLLADMPGAASASRQLRDRNFCNLGTSAQLIMDLVDGLVAQGEPPDHLVPELASRELEPVPVADQVRLLLRNAIYTVKHRLGIRQPIKTLVRNVLPWGSRS